VLGGLIAGQSGFFTAALLGGALLSVERRPILCGLLLSLLACKPQFGILVPFALAAGGQWRAFVSAAVSSVALLLAAGCVFGLATIPAFVNALPATTAILVHGEVGWNKIQSVYGAVHWLGGSDRVAVAVQAFVTAACVASVISLWRGRASFALKAAGLAAAIPLATPYVFVYDLPFLAIALAFLHRARSFDRIELAASLSALAPLIAFAVSPTPVALLSSLMVAAMIVRRAAPDREWGARMSCRREAEAESSAG
jgi:hypothetical protein